MTPALQSTRIHTLLAVGICSLLVGGVARSGEEVPQKPASKNPLTQKDLPQEALPQEGCPPEKAEKGSPQVLVAEKAPSPEAAPGQARVLLDQVKKTEQDRAIAAKQTEIDRLKEDQAKAETDAETLRKSMESTTGLITEANEQLTNLNNDSRRLEHELAISEARITAEQWKTAGLQALADAQGKVLSAMTRRGEETAARAHVRTIELEMLQAGQQPAREGHEVTQSDLEKARKALAIAEAKAESEDRIAHEAMKAAGVKMELAEAKSNYAQRLADSDLTLEPMKVTGRKAKPEKIAEKAATAKPAAIAAGPSSSPAPKPVPKPVNTKGAKTSKAPTATPVAKK